MADPAGANTPPAIIEPEPEEPSVSPPAPPPSTPAAEEPPAFILPGETMAVTTEDGKPVEAVVSDKADDGVANIQAIIDPEDHESPATDLEPEPEPEPILKPEQKVVVSEPELEPDAEPEPKPDIDPEAAPETILEPDPEPEPGLEPEPEIEAETGSEPTAPEPEAQLENNHTETGSEHKKPESEQDVELAVAEEEPQSEPSPEPQPEPEVLPETPPNQESPPTDASSDPAPEDQPEPIETEPAVIDAPVSRVQEDTVSLVSEGPGTTQEPLQEVEPETVAEEELVPAEETVLEDLDAPSAEPVAEEAQPEVKAEETKDDALSDTSESSKALKTVKSILKTPSAAEIRFKPRSRDKMRAKLPLGAPLVALLGREIGGVAKEILEKKSKGVNVQPALYAFKTALVTADK
ncbi:hypothetical protein BS50DRAFT_591505 [Corynespora cassiicola Philippines]|uniref:Uncharacterized protein n=1 Tax=Corynespora cassiicola Philippines TaxID=1448308 RepID=A0A2T2NDN7_CORCC|nr:hypothetical protein BS50DRAFT_591505 [Corynespora cassiicola Philippines]